MSFLEDQITELTEEDINMDLQRSLLDEVDEEICLLLAERQNITVKISTHKAKNKLNAEDKERESAQNKNLASLANRYHLDEAYLISIWDIFRTQSKKTHKDVKNILNE